MARYYQHMDPIVYAQLTATQIAQGVRDHLFTAEECVAASLKCIENLNPTLNAFTVVRHEDSLREARAVDKALARHETVGPLAGVPIAVKEEYDVAGMVTTLGGWGNSTPATADSEVIKRLREAGAIIVGKTTMSEFGQFPETDSQRYGITKNPWDTRRSPGGSSGGSAVAVAAGMVPIGMGADGGGSLRIPAAACGVVGLKPARGRVSPAPLRDPWHGLVVFGAITRTIEDMALVNDIISGSLPSDVYRAKPMQRSHMEALEGDSSTANVPLRIAYTSRSATPGISTAPVVEEALNRTVELLRSLGHDVRETRVPWPAAPDAFLLPFLSGMAREARSVEHREKLEARTRQTARMGENLPALLVKKARKRSKAYADAINERFLRSAHVLLVPTYPVETVKAGHVRGMSTLQALSASSGLVANTAVFNVSGHPALSLPAPVAEGALPIGMQFVTQSGREDLLIALGQQIEDACDGWPRLDVSHE